MSLHKIILCSQEGVLLPFTLFSACSAKPIQRLNYCSLAKECPWAEHLTSLPKRGLGALLSVSTFTTKERPCHVYSKLDDHTANNLRNSSVQWNHQWLRSWVLLAHSTLNGIMSPWAWSSSRCALHLLRLCMQRCFSFGEVLCEVFC